MEETHRSGEMLVGRGMWTRMSTSRPSPLTTSTWCTRSSRSLDVIVRAVPEQNRKNPREKKRCPPAYPPRNLAARCQTSQLFLRRSGTRRATSHGPRTAIASACSSSAAASAAGCEGRWRPPQRAHREAAMARR